MDFLFLLERFGSRKTFQRRLRWEKRPCSSSFVNGSRFTDNFVVLYFCDGLFMFKEAKQATLQLLRFFFTVARFELEPQICETQHYQTISSGNMPRRNLYCKYYVLKHITFQALEATQSHNAPLVDNAYIVLLQISTTPISFRSLVKAILGKGLVCISAVLSPLSILTASPPVRSRESLTKPGQIR